MYKLACNTFSNLAYQFDLCSDLKKITYSRFILIFAQSYREDLNKKIEKLLKDSYLGSCSITREEIKFQLENSL